MGLHKSSRDVLKEGEVDAELQDTQPESEIGTQVPVHSNGVPVGRTSYIYETHRGLKSRHIQLIALGGSIGTGLFVGTGTTLSLAGPAPLFMCKSHRSSSGTGTYWHSLRGNICHRLDCGSKPSRDDNLSPCRRSLRSILCPPLLRTLPGLCGRLELLVLVRHAGCCRSIRCQCCYRLLAESSVRSHRN